MRWDRVSEKASCTPVRYRVSKQHPSGGGGPTTDSAALERETKSGSHTRHSDLTEMHDDANALPFGGIGLPVRVGVRVSECCLCSGSRWLRPNVSRIEALSITSFSNFNRFSRLLEFLPRCSLKSLTQRVLYEVSLRRCTEHCLELFHSVVRRRVIRIL